MVALDWTAKLLCSMHTQHSPNAGKPQELRLAASGRLGGFGTPPPPVLAAKIRSAPLYRLFSWMVWVWVWVWVCKGGGDQPPFRNTLTSPPKKNKFWPLYMIVASVSGPHPTLGPQRGCGWGLPTLVGHRDATTQCNGNCVGDYNTMQQQLCW